MEERYSSRTKVQLPRNESQEHQRFERSIQKPNRYETLIIKQEQLTEEDSDDTVHNPVYEEIAARNTIERGRKDQAWP